MKEVIEKLDAMSEKSEANKAALEAKMTEQVEGVKSSLSAEIKVVKDEQDKIKEDLSAIMKKQGRQGLSGEPIEAKSFAQQINEAVENNIDGIKKFALEGKKGQSFGMEVKAVADVSTANVTGGTVYGAVYKPGIIMNPNQIGHMRTAIPVVNAGAGTDYYFMRENGVGEGAPAPTAEKKAAAATTQATGLKPQFDVDLVESSVKFETIAGFLVTSRKAMMNIPSFVSYLQSRVPEKLLDVEDAQVLYGDGTSPNLKGILTSGNFVAGSAAGTTPLIEKIINDLSLLEDTHKRPAAAIWMRPAHWWSFYKNKAAGSGEYDLPEIITWVGGQLFISGIPVFKTTALSTNDYVIGAAMGAEIQQQEGIRIEFFYEDGTNARTNQVTIRVEETIALPVYGSNYFVLGSSATA